jgi:hypothetical protein
MSDEPTETTHDADAIDGPEPARDSGTLRSAAFLCTVIAGLLVGVGALLTWATFGLADEGASSIDQVYKGIDLREGKVALGCAIVLLVGVMVFRGLARPGRTAVAVLMIAAGVVAVGAAGATALTIGTRLENEAVDKLVKTAVAAGVDPTEAETAARSQYDEVGLAVSLGAGVWITLAGGFLGFIGGTLSLAYATRLDEDDEGAVAAI